MKADRFSFRAFVTTSIVLLLLFAATYTTAVAVRSALRSREYAKLTDSAAAAGVAFAEGCLRANDNAVTWSSDKPLKPNTDCTGTEQETLSKYVKITTDYRTYFTVSGSGTDEQQISAASKGHVEILREDLLFTWDFDGDSRVSALAVPGDGTPIGTSISRY